GRFEPPRGPRARVSIPVVTVDDDRPGPVQLPGPGVQLLERVIDRAGQVCPLIVVCGQHLNQLRPPPGQLPQFIAPDLSRHDHPPSLLAAAPMPSHPAAPTRRAAAAGGHAHGRSSAVPGNPAHCPLVAAPWLGQWLSSSPVSNLGSAAGAVEGWCGYYPAMIEQ